MDIDYLLLLQNFRKLTGGIFDSFFTTFTELGNGLIPVCIMACIYWVVNKEIGVYLLMNFAFSFISNGFLKITACIYRPWIRDVRVMPVSDAKITATGYSFPSGHVSQSTALWGGLAAKMKSRSKVAMIASIVILALICFSRNYLGVHTPQDVLVSLCVVCIWLFIVSKIITWTEKGKNNDIILTLIVVVISVAITIYAMVKNYPIDYDEAGKILVDSKKMVPDTSYCTGAAIGFFIGWVLERRFVKFNVECSINQKIARLICGLPIVIFIVRAGFSIFKSFLPTAVTTFLYAFIMTFFVTYLYPLIFTKIEDAQKMKL
jgi:membrane-associated phospholipid phosphatase